MWAQDKNRIFVTVKLQDITGEMVSFLSDRFTFKASIPHPLKEYDMTLELFDEIAPDHVETRFVKFGRYLQINLWKAHPEKWWPRLAKTTQKLHNVRIDWEKWVDEPEEGSDFKIPNFTEDAKDVEDQGDNGETTPTEEETIEKHEETSVGQLNEVEQQ
jgi:hypothetical protein